MPVVIRRIVTAAERVACRVVATEVQLWPVETHSIPYFPAFTLLRSGWLARS